MLSIRSAVLLLIASASIASAATGDPYRYYFPEQEVMKVLYLRPSYFDFATKTIVPPRNKYSSTEGHIADYQKYLDVASYGQASFDVTHFPASDDTSILVLDAQDDNWFGENSWTAHAHALFRYQTVSGDTNLSPYRIHFVHQPRGPQGTAYVGGKRSKGNGTKGPMWHEWVHNLGFLHGFDMYTPVTTAGSGTFSAPMRAFKGWMRQNKGFQIINSSGTYRVYDLETPSLLGAGKAQALVVQRTGPNAADLWMEFRPNINLRKGDTTTRQGLRLINFYRPYTTGAETFEINTQGVDANFSLQLNNTFVDVSETRNGRQYTGTQVSIRPLSIDTTTTPHSMLVQITFPGAGNNPPVITSASAAPTPVVDDQTTLTATATDADGDTLSYAWSTLSAPSGANPVLATSSSASTGVTFDHAGSYTFRITVSDGAGGSVDQQVNVTVEPTVTSIEISSE